MQQNCSNQDKNPVILEEASVLNWLQFMHKVFCGVGSSLSTRLTCRWRWTQLLGFSLKLMPTKANRGAALTTGKDRLQGRKGQRARRISHPIPITSCHIISLHVLCYYIHKSSSFPPFSFLEHPHRHSRDLVFTSSSKSKQTSLVLICVFAKY